MTSTIIRNGSVPGAPVISISIKHIDADMRMSPPRKDAAPSSAYMPTAPGTATSRRPSAAIAFATMRPKQPPKMMPT